MKKKKNGRKKKDAKIRKHPKNVKKPIISVVSEL